MAGTLTQLHICHYRDNETITADKYRSPRYYDDIDEMFIGVDRDVSEMKHA